MLFFSAPLIVFLSIVLTLAAPITHSRHYRDLNHADAQAFALVKRAGPIVRSTSPDLLKPMPLLPGPALRIANPDPPNRNKNLPALPGPPNVNKHLPLTPTNRKSPASAPVTRHKLRKFDSKFPSRAAHTNKPLPKLPPVLRVKNPDLKHMYNNRKSRPLNPPSAWKYKGNTRG